MRKSISLGVIASLLVGCFAVFASIYSAQQVAADPFGPYRPQANCKRLTGFAAYTRGTEWYKWALEQHVKEPDDRSVGRFRVAIDCFYAGQYDYRGALMIGVMNHNGEAVERDYRSAIGWYQYALTGAQQATDKQIERLIHENIASAEAQMSGATGSNRQCIKRTRCRTESGMFKQCGMFTCPDKNVCETRCEYDAIRGGRAPWE
jgi:hypothetical protein